MRPALSLRAPMEKGSVDSGHDDSPVSHAHRLLERGFGRIHEVAWTGRAAVTDRAPADDVRHGAWILRGCLRRAFLRRGEDRCCRARHSVSIDALDRRHEYTLAVVAEERVGSAGGPGSVCDRLQQRPGGRRCRICEEQDRHGGAFRNSQLAKRGQAVGECRVETAAVDDVIVLPPPGRQWLPAPSQVPADPRVGCDKGPSHACADG